MARQPRRPSFSWRTSDRRAGADHLTASEINRFVREYDHALPDQDRPLDHRTARRARRVFLPGLTRHARAEGRDHVPRTVHGGRDVDLSGSHAEVVSNQATRTTNIKVADNKRGRHNGFEQIKKTN